MAGVMGLPEHGTLMESTARGLTCQAGQDVIARYRHGYNPSATNIAEAHVRIVWTISKSYILNFSVQRTKDLDQHSNPVRSTTDVRRDRWKMRMCLIESLYFACAKTQRIVDVLQAGDVDDTSRGEKHLHLHRG